jgi:hypothetical protein
MKAILLPAWKNGNIQTRATAKVPESLESAHSPRNLISEAMVGGF